LSQWTIRKVDSDRIQSFHMQALRRILGIRWYDKVSNAASSQWENETTRRHSLFGHICRLPENIPALQALQLSIEVHTGTRPAVDWKRPPGRPRRNWLQQVEEDIGLSVGAAWIAGQDRSMWRTLRPSAGQAQQWVSEWKLSRFLPRDAMHKRGLCCHAVSVCLSVRPSVTFVDHVKTNKHIFEIFSPSGSDTILVFPYQRGVPIFRREPP